MAPDYVAPDLPVVDRYRYDNDYEQAADTRREAAAIGWRDYFTDPYLQSIIALALENNRDLRITILNVEAARAHYRIQRSEQFPALGAQADMARSRTPASLSYFGREIVGSQYQVGLGVAGWELDFWGRVRSLKANALESYLATEEAQRAGTIQLIAQVADNYLALRELDERIRLATKTVESHQESWRIFTRRVQVGATSRLELTQVETLLTQAQALKAQLEQSRAGQWHALELLVGTALPPLTPDQTFSENDVFSWIKPGLPSELLIYRPDILAAEHRLKAANANIGAARAAFFPKIALTGLFGTASDDLSGLFESGSKAWSFTPNITLPLFDAGRRRANLQLSETLRDVAVAEYERAIQSAFRDVSDALAAHHWLTEQVSVAEAALKAQTERAYLSKLRYDNGAAAFLEVLDAQRDLLAAQQQLVQVRTALLNSRVALYAALGGGSLESTVP